MLNCEVCAQTQHHCCKASISFTVMEVIDLLQKAEEQGIDVQVKPSQEKDNYFNIVRRNKPIRSLNDENCIFLKDAKCSIYEERPTICRVYGSKMVKCWFNGFDYDTPVDKLFEMDETKIKDLTQQTMEENEKTVIKIFTEKMKK